MKLTEQKQLNWAKIENLKYLFNRWGRKSTERIRINTLDKSKLHLGVTEVPKADDFETPTFWTKPTGKKRAADILKSNAKSILHFSVFAPSIFDTEPQITSEYKTKKLYTPEKSSVKLTKLKYSNLEVTPLMRKPSNILNTKDISGAYPSKFRHTIKRIVQDANKGSHLKFDDKIVGDQACKYRPSIRVFNPYKNVSLSSLEKALIMPEFNISRNGWLFIANKCLRPHHSRNKSVDQMMRRPKRGGIHQSYESLKDYAISYALKFISFL